MRSKEHTSIHKRPMDLAFRIRMLKKLQYTIQKYEKNIQDALYTDLGKSETEGFMCEIGMTLHELSHQLRHIRQ